MLRTNIIASSISNLSDARYFAAWGAEALGFSLNEISEAEIHAFKDWVSGPKFIGEFSAANDYDQISQAINNVGLDYIQLDQLAPAEWKFDIPLIREITLDGDLKPADHYVLKFSEPIAQFGLYKDKIQEFCGKHSCYLDFHIPIEDLSSLITEANPSGIILRGGEEEKVGYKSFDELDEILELLDVNNLQ